MTNVLHVKRFFADQEEHYGRGASHEEHDRLVTEVQKSIVSHTERHLRSFHRFGLVDCSNSGRFEWIWRLAVTSSIWISFELALDLPRSEFCLILLLFVVATV